MSDNNLERRVERIEDELGIVPELAMFEERVEAFAAHSRVEIENIENSTATFTMSGRLHPNVIADIERRFIDWDYNQEEGVFQVSGLVEWDADDE